jgi:hypothetical protein
MLLYLLLWSDVVIDWSTKRSLSKSNEKWLAYIPYGLLKSVMAEELSETHRNRGENWEHPKKGFILCCSLRSSAFCCNLLYATIANSFFGHLIVLAHHPLFQLAINLSLLIQFPFSLKLALKYKPDYIFLHNLTRKLMSDVTNGGFWYKILITQCVGVSGRSDNPLSSGCLLSGIVSNASCWSSGSSLVREGLFSLLLCSSLIGRFSRVEMSGI